MPGKTMYSVGNLVLDTMLYAPALPVPTVGANAQVVNTATIPGLQVNDLVSWNVQGQVAHVALDNVWVSAPNTLSMVWSGDGTGGGNTTVACLFEVCRLDGANLGLSIFPQALV